MDLKSRVRILVEVLVLSLVSYTVCLVTSFINVYQSLSHSPVVPTGFISSGPLYFLYRTDGVRTNYPGQSRVSGRAGRWGVGVVKTTPLGPTLPVFPSVRRGKGVAPISSYSVLDPNVTTFVRCFFFFINVGNHWKRSTEY